VSLRSLSLLSASLLAIGSVACSAGGGGRTSASTGAGGSGSSGSLSGSGMGGSINVVGSSSGAGSGCDSVLDVTYRDFNESHPDFEMPFSGDVVRLTLLQPTLGADLTPVFRDSIGCPQDPNKPDACANWMPMQPVITSAATFDQWYHTVNGVNIKFAKTLTLTEQPLGSGTYVFDSANFFPLGPNEGWGITPKNNNPQGMNFLFTTEIHVNFEYKAGQVFTFRGDDDLWIFVNNKLALDIGSMHVATQGTINFDAQAAALGISAGGTYPMDIFQAARHTSASNFRFETNISCFTPGPVPK